MSTVIKIENLSKRYLINHKSNERQSSLRDVITSKIGASTRTIKDSLTGNKSKTLEFNHEEFWALKDLNLEISQGDRVGIIGRNGAGKSTLLKTLSRITEPTTGKISICGRVASLLEVGTGFHSELSGRENIFLNGAILGMSKSEIKARFDEIVDFAEIEKFLDTPVKRYSSGMYVRLAFSVAAHLESEILIIDEVLAVGDHEFQQKCLNIMENNNKQERTLLFVSHNLAMIQKICSKVCVLQNGKISFYGKTSEDITYYLNSLKSKAKKNLKKRRDRNGSGDIKFTNVEVLNSEFKQSFQIGCASKAVIKIEFECYNQEISNKGLIIGLGIYTQSIIRVASLRTDYVGYKININDNVIYFNLDSLQLVPGCYFISLYFAKNDVVLDHIQEAFKVTVLSEDYYFSGKLPIPGNGNLLLNYTCSKVP